MSDSEALMWHVGHDPFLDPTFGSLTVLGSAPDIDHLRSRLLRLVANTPRFGQRVSTPVGRLTPPAWCDDPRFDVDNHLRTVTLPPPGSRRQLLDLAVRLVQEPFADDRPQWEFVVIAGLADGGTGVVQRIHHTITDGEGGLRAAAAILDLEPGLAPLDEHTPAMQDASGPGALGLVAQTAGVAVQRAGRAAQSVVGEAVTLVAHPGQVPGAVSTGVETARSVIDQLKVHDRALSPLWTNRTLRRRLDTLDVPLAPMQATARAFGATVNDVFVTALTAAIGELHRESGRPAEQLRMAMPVSLRRRGSGAGNAFVPARIVVPVTDGDPRRRLTTIHDLLAPARDEPAFGVIEQLASVANLLPTPLVTRVLRDQARAVDFAASNLRGAPVPLWLAGAEVLADYPIGPLTAAALNVSLLSYDGTCNIGLHSDQGAVTDPERLAVLLGQSFSELFAA
ncbi:MAG: WS/DGAT domain-containing protein [Acidimicrobiales bacterium]|jgi:WS/DGAT/MGAT family acyltransferase|nr:WS/DGAT domain-containing protein [Acidimicrobiales bacterium]